MSGTNHQLLVPAQVVGPQGMGGAGGGMPSSLASAMMGAMGGQGAVQTPQIPLSTMLMMMQLMGNGQGGGITNGIGNLLNGYQWNGMAGQGMLDNLSSQAAGNIAGGAAI